MFDLLTKGVKNFVGKWKKAVDNPEVAVTMSVKDGQFLLGTAATPGNEQLLADIIYHVSQGNLMKQLVQQAITELGEKRGNIVVNRINDTLATLYDKMAAAKTEDEASEEDALVPASQAYQGGNDTHIELDE